MGQTCCVFEQGGLTEEVDGTGQVDELMADMQSNGPRTSPPLAQGTAAKLQWTWIGSASSSSLPDLNPMRWSRARAPEELIRELEASPGGRVRPVEVRLAGSRGLKFQDARIAAQWVRDSLLENRCFQDRLGPQLPFSDFLTGFFRLIWPKVAAAASSAMKAALDDALDSFARSLPPVLGAKVKHAVACQAMKLGEAAPEIRDVLSYKRFRQLEDGIEICGRLRWDAEVAIELDIGPVRLGINRIILEGLGCFLLRPLLDHEPVVGGFHLFFTSQPQLHVGLTGLGGITRWSLVDARLRRRIDEALMNMMVLPNRLVKKLSCATVCAMPNFRCPPPAGMLRIHVLAARDLAASDLTLVGPSTSDPYCTLQLADHKGRTKTIKKTCSPEWNNDTPFDFLIWHERQSLQLEVLDANVVRGDKSLGRLGVKDSHILSLLQYQAADDPEGDEGVWVPLSLAGAVDDRFVHRSAIKLKIKYFHWVAVEGKDRFPAQLPKAGGQVLLSLSLFYLEGAKPEHAQYAQVRLRVGGQEAVSGKCRSIQLGSAQGLTPEMISMICRLHEEGVSVDAISRALHQNRKTIHEVLREASNAPTGYGWEEALHMLVASPQDADVQLEVKLLGKWHAVGTRTKISDLQIANIDADFECMQYLPVHGYPAGRVSVTANWHLHNIAPLNVAEAIEHISSGMDKGVGWMDCSRNDDASTTADSKVTGSTQPYSRSNSPGSSPDSSVGSPPSAGKTVEDDTPAVQEGIKLMKKVTMILDELEAAPQTTSSSQDPAAEPRLPQRQQRWWSRRGG